jgi:hypothetical protein
MDDDAARFARDLRQARETSAVALVYPALFVVPAVAGFLLGPLGVSIAIPLGLLIMRNTRGVARGFAGSRALGVEQVGRHSDGTPILAKPSLLEYENMSADERMTTHRRAASQMDMAGLFLIFIGVIAMAFWVAKQFAPS